MSAELPVLVGIDGSHDGLVTLRWAAAYATRRQAPLHAVYVVDDHHEGDVDQSLAGPDDRTEVLDDALRELERIGFTEASLDVRRGHPAGELIELSKRSQALVVGRRGTGGFAELVVGSTSQACTALSTDVPLVVVPGTWDPAAPRRDRIVVGVDGSVESQDALSFAFELADRATTEILGVHAVELREGYPDPNAWVDPVQQPWVIDAEDLLAHALWGWQAKYPDVVVRQRSVAGHPVRVLAHESQDADLVVVGGTGRTAFSELRLGPVARGLLHHSKCPVAIIHHA